MYMRYALILLLSFGLVGWKAAPMKMDLASVTQNPGQFDGKKIEITAPVEENTYPRGDEYKKWQFVLGSDKAGIVVYEMGFNPATIVKAYYLVEEARKAGENVTVVGKFHAKPYERSEHGVKMQVDSVRFGDKVIHTDQGEFVPYYYGGRYPGSPVYYDGHIYYPLQQEFPY